ncbi:MAG: efflux RND transporter permease subunit [Planctomycetes bacterium]|nr:efflux RND transporter permease subunit [Planctomycetota bacterium]
MNLIEAFVRNPVKVAVGVLLVALFGGIALVTMPRQLTPEVTNPIITIETRWPGASPQEIEREIVQEQEEQLKAVEGVVKMTSECTDSEGEITLEFVVGTDFNEALLKVNSRLQQVPEYPLDADEPVISSRDISDRAIARFALMPRPPSVERVEQFQQSHPHLRDALEPVRRAMNPGLRLYRLERLVAENSEAHPELRDLAPPDIDLLKLRRFVEDVIEARLERVPGVADAEVNGGPEEELQVVVDPRRLAAQGFTIADVRSALEGHNKDTSAGDYWEGKRREIVRTLGRFQSPEEVEAVVLAVRGNTQVTVRHVADVRMGFKKPSDISRRYGSSSVSLSVSRTTGANVLEVMEGLKEATEELNTGVLAQQNLELYLYYDETEYIHSAVGLVEQNIFIGGALTVIVLMLFLHRGLRTVLVVPLIAATAVAAAYVSPWLFLATLALVVGSGFWFARGALIVSLAIPTSIVGTFLLLMLMGRSLNVISLAGLAFAVGMLVDNAIVVLENIHRRRQEGESALQAAVRGTSEVSGAVLASTLTTIAVFLPVLLIEETVGQLFRDIALAISCAVGLSLVVSFTLIPTSAARLFGFRTRYNAGASADETHAQAPVEGNGDGRANGRGRQAATGNVQALARGIAGGLDRVGGGFVKAVVGLNRWILAGRLRSLGTVAVFVAAVVLVLWAFWPRVEYLPTGNRNFVFASLSPPPGYNLEHLEEFGRKIETDLKPYWDANPGTPEAERLPYPIINYYFFVVRGRQIFMGFRADDPMRVRELIPLLREVGGQFPGTIAVARQSSLFERGSSGGRTIDVEITGPELERLIELGVLVKADVERLLPEAQALPQPSLELSSPEVHIEPDPSRSAELGFTVADLGYAVNALVDGAYAGDYFIGGDKVDLTILGAEETVRHNADLEGLLVATPSGDVVPLSAVANIALRSGPEQIHRRERQRTVTIQVTPPLTTPLEEAMERIESEIIAPLNARGELEGGYRITLSGTADDLRQAWHALRWNLFLALLITYLLMAALFESWLYPLVIIFSVPLGAIGGILGLEILNLFTFQALDVLTMLGFIILIGTVVNNAILIVHQALNHMRYEGLPPEQAITESVAGRIRPIFMTTLTTVLGLLPLVLFPGAGSELYRGLGSVILGGLIVSTVFTLVLVPTVFHLALGTRNRLARLAGFASDDVAGMSPPTPPPVAQEPKPQRPVSV